MQGRRETKREIKKTGEKREKRDHQSWFQCQSSWCDVSPGFSVDPVDNRGFSVDPAASTRPMRCPGSWGCLCASTSAQGLCEHSTRVASSHRATSRTSGHLFQATTAFLGEAWENRDTMSRHSGIQAPSHTGLQKCAFASQPLLQTTDWVFFFLWSLLGNFLHQSRDLFLHMQLPTPTSVLGCSSAVAECHWVLFAREVWGGTNLTVEMANTVWMC